MSPPPLCWSWQGARGNGTCALLIFLLKRGDSKSGIRFYGSNEFYYCVVLDFRMSSVS